MNCYYKSSFVASRFPEALPVIVHTDVASLSKYKASCTLALSLFTATRNGFAIEILSRPEVYRIYAAAGKIQFVCLIYGHHQEFLLSFVYWNFALKACSICSVKHDEAV